MAQPQQQQQPYLPRPFSPPRSTPSPGAHPSGAFLPPNKRQRLSPNPQSPYVSPSLANISLPSFRPPQSSTSPTAANGAFNIMAPQTAAGAMGPPSRPVEKATDMTELADVLASSGVDLKEEEAALTNPYLSTAQQNNNNSFISNNASSFNSTTSNGSSTGTLPVSNNFHQLSENVPGSRDAFYGGGTFNQPPAPYQAPEAFAEEQRRRAARRLAEKRQYHLNDPFLFTGSLKRKVFARADANHARLPMDGVYSPAPQRNASQPMLPVEVTAPDGTVVVATKGESFVYPDAPMVDIFALLSLAAEERIRSLVEDAAALALGRRIGSHGVVPPEWADLAVNNGLESATATFPPGRSGWESAVSPKTNPLKRSYSSSNKLPTPVSDHSKSPVPTISFPNTTAQTLRNLSQADRTAEEVRLAKRARRTANGSLLGDGSRSGSIPIGAPGSATPNGLLGERAPDVKTTTKKAAKKEAEAKATEAQQHQNTNATVSMALGGGGARNLFGKKKGGYSWLDKKPNAGQMTGFPVPSKLNTSVKTSDAATSGGTTSGSGGGGGGVGSGSGSGSGSYLPPGGKRIGEWREDKERGAGIQLRDLVSVLEADGKEKRVLARLYTKLSSKD